MVLSFFHQGGPNDLQRRTSLEEEEARAFLKQADPGTKMSEWHCESTVKRGKAIHGSQWDVRENCCGENCSYEEWREYFTDTGVRRKNGMQMSPPLSFSYFSV